MAFGVLEDRHLACPSGTSLLENSSSPTDDALSDDTSHLKRDGGIILIPQPSNDPNDPLTWPKLQKWAIVILLSVVSSAISSMSVMMAPAIPIISQQFSISTDTANTWTIGLSALWTGLGTFFTAAGSNIFGKRPFVIGSLFVMFITNAWGSFASSFTSLSALRTFQGFAASPYETIVTTTISDLFFLHQRGTWLAIWGVILSTGGVLGQLLSGIIIEQLGYNATFVVSSSIFAILLLLGYFVLLETTYTKPRIDVTQDKRASRKIRRVSMMNQKGKNPFEDPVMFRDSKLPTVSEEVVELRFSKKPAPPPKEPYAKQLRVYRGRTSTANLLTEMLKPFPLMVFPSVVYAAVINGIVTGLVIGVAVLSTIVLSQPPYNLTPSQLGLTSVPPFVASLVASPMSGWMADAIPRWMARKNNGVFEPEYRLTLIVVGLPLITTSYIGLGESLAQGQSLVLVLAWLSLQNFAFPFLIQGALSYVLDSHADDANLAFVSVAVFRAAFTFVSTSFMSGLYDSLGPRTFFLSVGAVNFAVLMTTLPLYIFGKKIRSAVDRSAIGKRRLAQLRKASQNT